MPKKSKLTPEEIALFLDGHYRTIKNAAESILSAANNQDEPNLNKFYWFHFEMLCAEILKRKGYIIEFIEPEFRAIPAGKAPYDIIAKSKDGKKIIMVQCKKSAFDQQDWWNLVDTDVPRVLRLQVYTRSALENVGNHFIPINKRRVVVEGYIMTPCNFGGQLKAESKADPHCPIKLIGFNELKDLIQETEIIDNSPLLIRIEKWEKREEEIKKIVRERDEQIKEANQRLGRAGNSIEIVLRREDELIVERARLSQDLEIIKSERQNLENTLQEVQIQAQEAQQEVEQSNLSIAEKDAIIRQIMDNYMEDETRFERELEARNWEMQEKEKEIDQKNREIQQISQKIQALENKNEINSKINIQLTQGREKLKEELENANREKVQMQDELEITRWETEEKVRQIEESYNLTIAQKVAMTERIQADFMQNERFFQESLAELSQNIEQKEWELGEKEVTITQMAQDLEKKENLQTQIFQYLDGLHHKFFDLNKQNWFLEIQAREKSLAERMWMFVSACIFVMLSILAVKIGFF